MKILLTAKSAIAIGLIGATVSLAGCSPASQQTELNIVTKVNASLPGIEAAANTVAATVEALDPAYAPLIAVGDTSFQALATTLQALSKAYIANPSASVLAQIQTAINTLEANLNTATLNAVGIKDPTSQRLAMAALQGLLTLVTVAFGLISSTESKAQLEQLRDTNTIHLAKVRKYMDQEKLQVAAAQNGLDVDQAFGRAAAFGF